MLKLTVEGENLSELTANVNQLAADLNGGATPGAIASTGTTNKKKTTEDKPKKLTLQNVQDALVAFQDGATDKKKARETVKELLGRYSVKSSADLPEAEYEDFLKDIAELS